MSTDIIHNEVDVGLPPLSDHSTLRGDADDHKHDMKDEKEVFDPSSPSISPVTIMQDFPDGGFRAWLVVFGVGHRSSVSVLH